MIANLFVSLAEHLAYRIWGIEATCFILRHLPGTWNTTKLLRRRGAEIGPNVTFAGFLRIDHADKDFRNLYIGRKTHVGQSVYIDLSAMVTIKEEVPIGQEVMLITHQEVGKNRHLDLTMPRKRAPIFIGHGAYLGARSTVLAGVHVKSGSIVGACALVTKNTVTYEVCGGVPARKIKEIKYVATDGAGIVDG